MRKQHILFIVNPISGTRSKNHLDNLICDMLDLTQYDYEIAYTQYAGHASELAAAARLKQLDIVVAVGGDGTVNEVARTLVHSTTALGIIPYGSGNGLARHLHIPMHPEQAIRLINRKEIRQLDYGLIDSRPFFCTCGVGFDAFVSYKFANSTRRGMLSYLENALREGLNYEPETYLIETEETTEQYEAFLIACANASQYGNNAYIAPKASMEDGLFDVIIVEPFSAIEVPQLAIQLFNKTLDRNSHIKTFRTKKLRIHRQHGGEAHCDGEPILTDKDVHIELKRKGINVVVNPDIYVTGKDNLIQVITERFRELAKLHDEFVRRGDTLNKSIFRTITKNKSKNSE